MAALEYKEPDRPYVAKQLNGPIISGFIKAVYNFFHMALDHHTEYGICFCGGVSEQCSAG